MVQLSYKVKIACKYICVARRFRASQLTSMSWLLSSIIVKYMDIISRALAWHTTDNLLVRDGPCLLGHRVKKGEDSRYTLFVAKYYLLRCTVLMYLFDRYDDNISQYITINLIMTVRSCLATRMSSEEKADS